MHPCKLQLWVTDNNENLYYARYDKPLNKTLLDVAKNVWKSILHVMQRHEDGLQLSNVEHQILQIYVEAVITNAFKIIIVMKK